MNEHSTLKYTRPMMHGSAVIRLQEMLDLLGFDGGPNDGIYGPATERMVARFQESAGMKVDGICGPKTWLEIFARLNSKASRIFKMDESTGIVDRRGLHARPKLYKCGRYWSAITGVTMHQTGCAMPSNPAGWDRVNAHIGITQEGIVILINDPIDFIWHAQGLSASTIGIEIEGNYQGIDGDMSTLWRGGGGPHHLNPAMIAAAERARLWIAEQFRMAGEEWQSIYAHRQSKDTRIADPGEEIWKKIAIPWFWGIVGIGNLPSAEFSCGSGRPIPAEWNCACYHKYNCKPGAK
jgi:hypothetical protein